MGRYNLFNKSRISTRSGDHNAFDIALHKDIFQSVNSVKISFIILKDLFDKESDQ